MLSLNADRLLAEQVVVAAGQEILQFFDQPLEVYFKDSQVNAPVTIADQRAEQLIVKLLQEARPDDGLLGEEGACVSSQTGKQWLIDPLDGTLLFTRGLSGWTTTVALLENKQAAVSAIYDPLSQDLWSACTSAPSTLNGRPIQTTDCQNLKQAILHAAFPNLRSPDNDQVRKALTVIQTAGGALALGAPSISLAALATGKIDAWINIKVKPWDWYPGASLVRAAGGSIASVGDWKIAAATEELLQEIIKLLV